MDALILALVFSVVINLLMFVPAYLFQTDKLTDLSYGLSFIALSLFGFLRSAMSFQQQLLLAMVMLWAIRLGLFLFIRISHMQRDKRFDGIRNNFRKFLGFWLLQAVSVFIISVDYLLYLSNHHKQLALLSAAGIIVLAGGLVIEAVADYQKYCFSLVISNKGKWIDHGLWKLSRHPNYIGEILVWLGIYIYTFSALSGSDKLVGLISPVYIVLILLFVSGIPPLEQKAELKWGQDLDYQQYKKRTPLLIPSFFK